MVVYKYLGYGKTDNNGRAKLEFDSDGQPIEHSYTGTGAGKVDFIASLDSEISEDSLISDIYSLYDMLFYDRGTSVPAENTWIINGFIPSYSENGTRLISTSYATCFANKKGSGSNPIDWNSPVCIELDIGNLNSSDGGIQIYDGNNNCSRTFTQLEINGNNHIKIVVESDRIRYYVDGVEKTNYGYDLTIGTFRVGLRGTGMITFKDFMIYPI